MRFDCFNICRSFFFLRIRSNKINIRRIENKKIKKQMKK